MSEIKDRLKNTSEACLKAYESWDADQKSTSAREALQESIHELRKVTSRLEIELAISERDQNAQKQIPIPPHRAARNKGAQERANEMQGDNKGNGDDKPAKKMPKVEKRRSSPRKAASGGEG